METESERRARVMKEINLKKEARQKEAQNRWQAKYGIHGLEQGTYLSKLDECLRVLPTKSKVPRKWTDGNLREAQARARIIVNRLAALQKGGAS